MYSPLQLAGKYLHYYFTAANGKGHGIHSPFVFGFITSILNDRQAYPEYVPIEALRSRLLRDQTLIEIDDLGAGSTHKTASTRSIASSVRHVASIRSIASVARHAAKPPRLGQLLFRVVRHYRPSTILELGTSLGVSTAYLAAAAPATNNTQLYTIEGSPAIAEMARANLRSLNLDACLQIGNFDTVLPEMLPTIPPPDLVFVDGNHRLEPTLRYFQLLMDRVSRPAILIFDDIHWSAEMEQAWAAIKADPRIGLTIDLFFLGFAFLRDEFKVKQDFVIRF
jgi:predicted O-methyltransferase YrrM